jgi:hypothetical protein
LLNLETLQCNVPQCRCYRLQQQQHYTDAWGPTIMCFAALLYGCCRLRKTQADSCIAPCSQLPARLAPALQYSVARRSQRSIVQTDLLQCG